MVILPFFCRAAAAANTRAWKLLDRTRPGSPVLRRTEASDAKTPAATMSKHVLVTGASSGIGLALCKLLVRDHGCHVYLGARNGAKGEACLKQLLAEVPAAAGKIELLAIDVTDDASVSAAAASLKAKGVTLYGLVNNAGVGLAQPGAPDGPEAILATNLYGVKRVSEAMVMHIEG